MRLLLIARAKRRSRTLSLRGTRFNHPLNQVVHKRAPAIAAGAPIVLKPSEKTPLAGLWLARAIADIGYPENALAVVTGDSTAAVGGWTKVVIGTSSWYSGALSLRFRRSRPPASSRASRRGRRARGRLPR